MRMASHLEPSEPHTEGPMPGTSDGPITTAPAPSPSRKEMERSWLSMTSESFSTPITSTLVESPERTRESAWATP